MGASYTSAAFHAHASFNGESQHSSGGVCHTFILIISLHLTFLFPAVISHPPFQSPSLFSVVGLERQIEQDEASAKERGAAHHSDTKQLRLLYFYFSTPEHTNYTTLGRSLDPPSTNTHHGRPNTIQPEAAPCPGRTIGDLGERLDGSVSTTTQHQAHEHAEPTTVGQYCRPTTSPRCISTAISTIPTVVLIAPQPPTDTHCAIGPTFPTLQKHAVITMSNALPLGEPGTSR